jgi:hypothetical protein
MKRIAILSVLALSSVAAFAEKLSSTNDPTYQVKTFLTLAHSAERSDGRRLAEGIVIGIIAEGAWNNQVCTSGTRFSTVLEHEVAVMDSAIDNGTDDGKTDWRILLPILIERDFPCPTK